MATRDAAGAEPATGAGDLLAGLEERTTAPGGRVEYRAALSGATKTSEELARRIYQGYEGVAR